MQKLLCQASDRSKRQNKFAVVALRSELAFPPLVIGLQDSGVAIGRSLLPVRIIGNQWIEQHAPDKKKQKKKKHGLLNNSFSMTIPSRENCTHSVASRMKFSAETNGSCGPKGAPVLPQQDASFASEGLSIHLRLQSPSRFVEKLD
jgi:hypothetical protein